MDEHLADEHLVSATPPAIQIRLIVQGALFALAGAGTTAILVMWGLTRLQTDALLGVFPPDAAPGELSARLDLMLRHGPLLLVVSGGVTGTILAWQTGLAAQRVSRPLRQSLITGLCTAIVILAFAQGLGVPLTFGLPLVLLILGAALAGAWLAR
jgi:hypothetical protein